MQLLFEDRSKRLIYTQSYLNTLQICLFLTQKILPETHTPPAVPWTHHICRLQSGSGSLMCMVQNSRCVLYNYSRGKGRKRITVKLSLFPFVCLRRHVSCLPCQTGSLPVSDFLCHLPQNLFVFLSFSIHHSVSSGSGEASLLESISKKM